MREIASILGLFQLQFLIFCCFCILEAIKNWRIIKELPAHNFLLSFTENGLYMSSINLLLRWYYGNITMNFCCHIWTWGVLVILYQVPPLLYSRMWQPLWSYLWLQAIAWESEMVNYWSCHGAWQRTRRSGKWVRLLLYLLVLPLLHKGMVDMTEAVALQNKGKFGLCYVLSSWDSNFL